MWWKQETLSWKWIKIQQWKVAEKEDIGQFEGKDEGNKVAG